jgi:hypothetical protein
VVPSKNAIASVLLTPPPPQPARRPGGPGQRPAAFAAELRPGHGAEVTGRAHQLSGDDVLGQAGQHPGHRAGGSRSADKCTN